MVPAKYSVYLLLALTLYGWHVAFLLLVLSNSKWMRARNTSAIGYFMYRSFSIEKFNILVIECVYVIFMELRANRGYFHLRAELSNWFL
jgi:uncharacterized membrane protein (DUF485 family)